MAYNTGLLASQRQDYRDKHQANQQQIQIGKEARSRRDINDATRSYRNQIDNLKNGYKRTTGATLTDQQAIEELMGDRAFQQVAEKYINSNPALMQDLFKGRDGVGDTYERMVGVQYMPGEEGKSGSWVPTLKATKKGLAESLMEYLPFTENKTSEPDDPVTQLSSEDVFNFINGEKGLNAGVDLGASRRYMDSQNAGLGEDVPLMNIDQATRRMQQRRAPGQTDAAALGNLNTFDPNSGRSQQLARYAKAEEARVATETAAAAAKANYALKAQEQAASQKKAQALASDERAHKTRVANRKIAVDNIQEEVGKGNLAAVMAAIPQLSDTDSPAMQKQMDTWKKRALITSLRKNYEFGKTEGWEWFDKDGIWDSFFSGARGYTAGAMDVTSILRKRMEIDIEASGTYLYPLNNEGKRAGDPINMDKLGDAERTMLTNYLNPNRKEVVGVDGMPRLLTEAQTKQFEDAKTLASLPQPDIRKGQPRVAK
jgi:hypothetical protein